MYYTLKLRMKLDFESKEYLLTYENKYQNELIKIVKDMFRTGNVMYKGRKIDNSIDRNSQWQLYQIALKNYQAQKLRKHFQYERSSTWNTKSFYYHDGRLILYFGTDFHVPQVEITISLTEQEQRYLEENRIVRMDITHDEMFWFANFIIQTG